MTAGTWSGGYRRRARSGWPSMLVRPTAWSSPESRCWRSQCLHDPSRGRQRLPTSRRSIWSVCPAQPRRVSTSGMMRSALAANWHACVPFRAVTGDLRCPRPAAVVGRSGRSGVCFRSVIESMEKRGPSCVRVCVGSRWEAAPPGLSAVVLTPPWTMAEEKSTCRVCPPCL